MPKIIDEIKIFDAALDLFVAHGYEGATTRKIAELAGVNEVTLFRKYGSKAGLFEKAIEHRFSDTPLNRLDYTGGLEADLLVFVEAYIETVEIHGDLVSILLVELPRNPDLQGLFKAPWKNILVMISILQKYQEQGLLIRESPLVSLSAMIGPIMASQMLRRANLGLPVPTVDPQAYVDTFLRGRAL